ncbi:unnamed protein product, partial [Rangifer tarandus platyrhynchus]
FLDPVFIPKVSPQHSGQCLTHHIAQVSSPLLPDQEQHSRMRRGSWAGKPPNELILYLSSWWTRA